MDAESVLNLFDFYWFDQEIITKSPPSPSLPTSNLEINKESKKPEPFRAPSRHVRSLSDQLHSETNLSSDSSSPKSVISQYQLQTILSGKEVYQEAPKIEILEKRKVEKKRRNRGASSKSLSDLEFEELKGFMDLGFVFCEEDKNSSLVSIIPGLQRLGKEDQEEEEESLVSRPYLSEAWEVMNEKEAMENPFMMNWRFPSFNNEIGMKDHLRSWAHTVASAVR